MELEYILAIAMFLGAIIALLAGYPVALTLGGVALLFALIGIALGVFPEPLLKTLPSRILGGSIMQSQVLLAIPLFVLMGVILERSRVAEDLLSIASRLLGQVRGGLAYAVILVGAMLAASTGVVGATVIAMSLIALPSMIRQGYDVRLATGTIAASGTLGQIIPPSIILILLADAISNAASQASLRGGNGALVVSVGDLFAGALIPGLMLVGLYLAYVFFLSVVRPSACPPAKLEPGTPPLDFKQVAYGLGAPLLLIFAVLGSILGGVAPPTEAAAIGAGGALLLAGQRAAGDLKSRLRPIILAGLVACVGILFLRNLLDLRTGLETISGANGLGIIAAAIAGIVLFVSLGASLLALHRKNQAVGALQSTASITSMVFLILIGASLFSLVFRGFGGDDLVHGLLTAMPGGKWGALGLTMLVMFVLGFFLDFIEIVFVVVPLVAPPLIILGCDPIWLAIVMAVNLQTSFLTPPFGFALFYLRGAAPHSVSTLDIWRGAIPFIGLQAFAIALIVIFPALATWLPGMLIK